MTTNSRLQSVLAALAAYSGAPAQGAQRGALAQLQSAWNRQNPQWASDPSAGLFSASGAPVYWQPLQWRAPPSQAPAAAPAAPTPAPAPAAATPSAPGPARGESSSPPPTPAPPPNPLQTPTTPLTPGGSISLNPPAPAPVTSLASAAPAGTNGASSSYTPSLIPRPTPPSDPYALDPTGVRLSTGGDSTFNTGLTNTEASRAGSLAGLLTGTGPVLGAAAGLGNAAANALGSLGSGQVPEAQFPRAPAALPDASRPDNSLPTTPGGNVSLAPAPAPADTPFVLSGGSLNAPRATTVNTPAPPPLPSVIRYPNGVTYDPRTGMGTFPAGTSPFGYNGNTETRRASAADAARAGGASSTPTGTSSGGWRPDYSLSGTNARLGDSNAPGTVSLAPAPAPASSPFSLGSASFSTADSDGYAAGGSVAGPDNDPGDPFQVLLDTYHDAYPHGFDLRAMQSPDAFGYRQALIKALMAGDYRAVEQIRQMAAMYEDMFASRQQPNQDEEQ